MRDGEAAMNLSNPEDDFATPEPVRLLMSPEDKDTFLVSDSTMAAIRRVARSRGVPFQDHEDVVQQTCTRAWKARLPADPLEARRVVNRIAHAMACTHTRVDPRGVPQSYEENSEEAELAAHAADAAPDAALREQVEMLLDKGRAKFPNRFDSFLASVLGRAPATEEAARRGVTDAHVRKERSEIRQYLQLHGRKMGLLTAATLVILVFGSMRDWTRSNVANPDAWSDFRSMRREAPRPAADAASLRIRAADRFRNFAFEACLEDLDAAQAIDGKPDTADEARMRDEANDALRMNDAVRGPLK